MKKLSVCLLGVGLSVCQAAFASTIVYNNLGPGDTYAGSGNWFGTGGTQYTIVAGQFVPTGSGLLFEISGGITYSTGVNEFTLSLLADSAGAPGAELWSHTYYNALGSSAFHAWNVQGPQLTAGTPYWLAATAPEDGSARHSWWVNNQSDYGPRALDVDHGGWTVYDASYVERFSMRIGVGEPITIPEPATLLLCLGGVVFVVARLRCKFTPLATSPSVEEQP